VFKGHGFEQGIERTGGYLLFLADVFLEKREKEEWIYMGIRFVVDRRKERGCL
jgi:hypothetical protein